MRLRRFTGADPGAALRRVKEVLGPEAVILATRACPEGGVEITAAVDLDSAVLERDERPAGRAPAAGGPDLAEIARELRLLGARVQRMDRGLRGAAHPGRGLGAEARALAERLVLHGIDAERATRVGQSFARARGRGAAETAALAEGLARHVLLPDATPAEARVTAFVGPTGGGKTTTVAKLAAARLARGGAAVGLVMADTYRIGAAEQLGAYARLLGVPMQVAGDAGALAGALARFADRDAVYVDTAGFGGDPAAVRDLRRLLAGAGDDLAVTAVVSAATSAAARDRLWTRLEPLAPRAGVVTKLDEAPGLGATCSWLCDVGVRLRWLGTGQRVPQDLTEASADALAHWMLAA